METVNFSLPNATIILYSQFFTPIESAYYFTALQQHIQWQEKEITLFGKKIMQPRLLAFYGDEGVSYKYSRTIFNALPWVNELTEIKYKIQKKLGLEFNSCLCNYYRNGQDSMGWHQDNEKELRPNPTIVSVSFGATRSFHFKNIDHPSLKIKIPLTNGSALLMAGETQHFYKHQIPKSKNILEPRINLTLRNIK